MAIQIIITVFAAFAASRIYLQWRNKHVGIGAFLFWMIIWSSILFFTYWPGLMSMVADFLGIGRGVDVFVYLGIMMLFYMSYRLYIKHEELNQRLNEVVRKTALKDIKSDQS